MRHLQGEPSQYAGTRFVAASIIILGAVKSLECYESLCSLKRTCRELGVPLAEKKQDGRAYIGDNIPGYYY